MKNARSRGFTLIELLVVIAIIAILAAILFPIFSSAKEKGRQASCLNNMGQLSKGFQMYIDDWRKYPGAAPWNATTSGTKQGGNYVVLIWAASGPATYPIKGVDVKSGALFSYTRNEGIYVCPSDAHNTELKFGLSYSMNAYLAIESASDPNQTTRLTESDVRNHSQCVLLVDEAKGCMENGAPLVINDGYFGSGYDVPTAAHIEGANFAYCDGHARWTKRTNFAKLIFDPSK